MLLPATKAISTKIITSLSSSTQEFFDPLAEYIEINAINQAILCHLGATASATNNGFDWCVLPGQTKVFRISQDMRGNDKYVALIEQAAGATAIVNQYQRN